MKNVLLSLIVLLAASLACGNGSVGNESATADSSQGNSIPANSSQSAPPTDPYKQTNQIYTHKSGAFSLPKLDGWSEAEDNTSATFTVPNDDIQVKISIYNIGSDYSLNGLVNYAFALDTMNFGSKDNYQGLNYTPNEAEHSVTTDKRYSLGDKYYYVLSNYHQEGQVVYATELFAHSFNWQVYGKSFPDFVKTIQYDNSKATNLPVQKIQLKTETFNAPNDAFTIEIPSAWEHSFDDSYPHTTIDSFVSADKLASVQIISYIDKYTWNQVYAGKVALQLLNNLYTKGAGDIKILADTPQTDGKRERLDWTSTKGGYSGITYFEAHGKQLVLLSLIYTNSYDYFYKPVLEQIADSYKSP